MLVKGDCSLGSDSGNIYSWFLLLKTVTLKNTKVKKIHWLHIIVFLKFWVLLLTDQIQDIGLCKLELKSHSTKNSYTKFILGKDQIQSNSLTILGFNSTSSHYMSNIIASPNLDFLSLLPTLIQSWISAVSTSLHPHCQHTKSRISSTLTYIIVTDFKLVSWIPFSTLYHEWVFLKYKSDHDFCQFKTFQ